MRGSAYHFAEKARSLPESPAFDLIFASDFLNLPDFIAGCPRKMRQIPTVAYFHENQITYPLGEQAPKDFHYGWINLSTAMTADKVLFNSHFHRHAFLAESKKVFSRMPDYVPTQSMESLFQESEVFPVGIDFTPHQSFKNLRAEKANGDRELTILWNHRWEYDKGPDEFFNSLIRLKNKNVPFKLIVCGQSFKNCPDIFERAQVELAERIVHFGYFEKEEDYYKALATADIVVSTAKHEFFGVSVVEAIHSGCLPVLPRRLSYPDIIPPHLHPLFIYEDAEGAFEPFLESMLKNPPEEYRQELIEETSTYDWRTLARELDAVLERVNSSS